MEAIICIECGLCCHLVCYGAKTETTVMKNEKEEEYRMFVCDKCLEGKKDLVESSEREKVRK